MSNLGCCVFFTTFCPYFLHLYPSSSTSTSLMVLKQNLGSLTFLLAFIFFIFIVETPIWWWLWWLWLWLWSSPPHDLLLLKHSFTSPHALEKNTYFFCMILWGIICMKYSKKIYKSSRLFFYHRFELDLCKERRWGPPKWSWSWLSLCLRDESRVSERLMEGGCGFGASQGKEVKVLRDCWHANGGKVKFEGKEKKPSCGWASWWSSSYKPWLSMAWDVDAIREFGLEEDQKQSRRRRRRRSETKKKKLIKCLEEIKCEKLI